MTTISLDSLGCKLNQAEVEALARRLAQAGYTVVSPEEKADIFVLNTCTVTHVADRKSRQRLRAVRRRHPGTRLVAIGCCAERAPRELERIEGVELVLGNESKWRLLELLGRPGEARQRGGRVKEKARRTRAFIRVQDGCHNLCAYCIVPLVRRREECQPADNVVVGVRERVSEGCREVVLTGTEVGSYRSGETDLAGLLERVLAETDIRRLRLSSLQPPEVTPQLIGLWRNPRLCPHFHLSLQSGSDGVLRRMKRRYDVAGYARAVSLIRDMVPGVAVTTDIIVGFPGETDAEFEASFDFCRGMGFARIHVFPYSPRPGTAAAAMPPVADGIRERQRQRMLALARESRKEFNRRFLGETLEVLWEQQVNGVWSGLTGNYVKVYGRSRADLTNDIMPVRLVKSYRDGVWGEIV
jgi:threonylcarbamoyladenosine tRNA methylthiotransferase MtaB